MNVKSMKVGVTLGLSALLLAACGPQNVAVTPAPDPGPLTPPAAPVVGRATEVQNAPAVVDRAAATLASMVSPANPDLDPDLATLLQLLGGGAMQGLSASPLGRELAGAFTGRGLQPLTTPAVQSNPLPTGTYTLDAAGRVSYTVEPTSGYVIKDLRAGTALAVDWRVGGAGTVWVESTAGGPYTVRIRQEVPTRASATFAKGTRTLAAAALGMTPGACLETAGPDALSLTAWAGREQNPPAGVNLQYAWTDTGITLKASATYRTRAQTAEAGLDLDLRGTTANRCTPGALAFTPTRADLTASASVPGHAVTASLNLRKLGGLVISDAELRAASPFARVTGDLSAGVTHNGQPMLSAFGPLADGADVDLLPGDGVVVRYVQGGKLVETTLPEALKKLFP